MTGERKWRLAALAVCTFAAAASLSTPTRAATYYVDPNYTGTNGAPYENYTAAYNSVDAALGSSGVPSGASASSPNMIYFAPGVYNTAASTGTSLSYSKNNVDLIGLDGNANDVVITSTLDSDYNPGSGAIGTSGSATLQLKGNNVTAENITFANSTDTPYIANDVKVAVTPTGSYTGNAQTTNAPAVALLLQGDEQAFQNCDFLGYQDTLYTKGGRTYFNDCTVSGDVDFIFANGTDVFNNSTINLDGDHSGGDITAASTDKRTSNGLVFLNSVVTGNSVHGNPVIDPMNAANVNGPAAGSMYLGRPWGWEQAGGDSSAVFINTEMTPAINSAGWLAWNSNETTANTKNNGNPGEDSRFAEFNSMDLSGNPLDTSGRVSWSHQLTDSQAADYTVPNLFADSPDTWYGLGYSGSADPTSPDYSWPAFWGPRNQENDANNVNVVGNPTSYSDPSWTVAGNWDPVAQLALVPEPATLSVLGAGAMGCLLRRRRAGKMTR
ncbi:MAG TPA: pectinesterase family protein [Tepidisphaeraceae bacterium]|nr:pectinesterase family protein [Tepidisphaeraceae bacterium]